MKNTLGKQPEKVHAHLTPALNKKNPQKTEASSYASKPYLILRNWACSITFYADDAKLLASGLAFQQVCTTTLWELVQQQTEN